MEKENQIAKIVLEIDPEQLREITGSGRLEKFVDAATEIFRKDLKAELVTQAAVVQTNLVMMYGRYGTGPRPPWWYDMGRVTKLEGDVAALKVLLAGQ
jgi:hypothetical protein